MGDTEPSSAQNTPPVSGTSTPIGGRPPSNAKPKPTKREVKILMLHGYTQSGPLFRAKTRALEKLLAKALSPINLVPALIYPTAPNRLYPKDIPGYQPPSSSETEDAENEIDSWAWFRKDEATSEYRLFKEGMLSLASSISEAGGGIEGVIGFSQGGCIASVLASALETEREVGNEESKEWVEKLREANGGERLKFAVIYSGFWAVPESLSSWLYQPKVKTPTLHYLGGLDTVVDESRSLGLVERCEEPKHVLTHPGGHYVPVSKEWVMPLAGFVKKSLEDAAPSQKEEKL
ncbi:putative seine hydrolase [Podospora australis]|uniref:Seine hydrolase n=1 Tax=Podospora australis TaxID=1536484 RepID=A0AAN7AGG8_9PEZI|nr:putative seine hydrolase [Podospora australis]